MRNNLFLGIILITFGLFFLLDNLDVADFGDLIHDFWPLLIIVWGLSILVRYRSTPAPSVASSQPASDRESFNESTVFGNLYSNNSSQAFKGGSISTIFGNCDIDLTNAAVAEGEHVMKVHGVFGDTTIILPKDCATSVHATSVLGTLMILGQRKEGIATELAIATPGYDVAERRLKISLSKVFGNTRIG